MINALTIDVEDYYSIVMRDWLGIDAQPTEAVVRNTSHMLELLAEHGVKATFFVLGEVAEAFPKLVREIAGGGHEVGVHGYYHRQFFKLTPEQAHQEVGDAKKLIEDIIGQHVEGHRAPAFSIRPDTKWAFEVLAELGFKYDSSVYPITGKRYGWPGFPPDIHEMTLPNGATIIEAPLSTVRIFGKMIPACGGGYLRHFPYWFTRWEMRQIQRIQPAIVYVHPYDMDTERAPDDFETVIAAAPRPVKKFHTRQLWNRGSVQTKLNRLLEQFEFEPLVKLIYSVLQ